MAFHRLTTPSYFGGLPGGYDYINNAVSGTPAPADTVKVGGPNAGSYFIAFGEDATAYNSNRANKALAENTDALDDLLRRDIAVPTRADTAGGGSPVSSFVLPAGTFVGVAGTPNTTAGINTFVSITDQNDNELIIASTGQQCMVTAISGATVGTGFASGAVTCTVSPSIPAGTAYRVYYGIRSNLATLPQDAFTTIKIRGAQELPAAFEDFEKQIVRFSGSNVAAVVASLIETPDGTRLAKSAELRFNVDPDNSQTSGTRFFTFQIGTLLTPITINDNSLSITGVDSKLQRSSGCLDYWAGDGKLRTANWTAGAAAGEDYLAITGSTSTKGDRYLRVGEIGIGSSSFGDVTGRSLVRALNARQEITIGNGTSSFGDFNGADALRDAIRFVGSTLTGASGSVTIRVKRGTYTWTQGITSNIPFNVRIIGDGRDLVILRYTSGALFDYTTGTSGSRLSIEHVTLDGGTGDIQDIVTTANNLHFFALIACNVRGALGSTFRGTSLVFIDRVDWDAGTTYAGSTCSSSTRPMLRMLINASGDANSGFSKLVARESLFRAPYQLVSANETGRSILEFGTSATFTGIYTIDAAQFERCTFFPRKTTISSNTMASNPGVVSCNTPSNRYPVGGLFVRKLSFKDCFASPSSSAGSSITAPVLYLIPNQNGVTYSSGTVGEVGFGEIELDGGKWQVGEGKHTCPPFLVANPWGKVSIKGTRLGWSDPIADSSGNFVTDTIDRCTVGAFTTEVGYFFNRQQTTSWSATSTDGGLVSLMGKQLVLDNVDVIGCRQNQNASDLFVASGSRTVINNIAFSYVERQGGGGSAVPPIYRVRFRPFTNNSDVTVKVDGMVMRGPGTVTTFNDLDWAQAGTTTGGSFLFYEPSSSSFKHKAVFRRVRIERFLRDSLAYSAAYGISLQADVNQSGYVFEDCAVDAVYNGWLHRNGSSDFLLSDAAITRCAFTNCGSTGIYESGGGTNGGTGGSRDLRISNCLISGNGAYGIFWFALNNKANADIFHNAIYANNGGAANEQVYCANGQTSDSIRGCFVQFQGNNLRDPSSGTVGKAQFVFDAQGGSRDLATGQGGGADNTLARGMETGFVGAVSGANATITGASRSFVTATNMLYNTGILRTP